MPKITIRRGDQLDREIDLADQDLRIGRGEQNDIVLADPTKAVSRFHAELRAENGRYVLLDLNSQNGLWSGGKKHQKITLEPGVPVTVGPYTLTLSGLPVRSVTSETMPGDSASGLRPGDTLPRGASRPPAPPPVPGGRAAPPPRPSTVKPGAVPAPGLIAALARMPKPLLFGGFAVFMIVVMAIGQLFSPASQIPIGEEPEKPKVAGPTNAEIMRKHLTEAGALMDRGDFDGAIKEVDQVLVVDPASIEAIELRAKAEDLKAKLFAGPIEPKPLTPEPLVPPPPAATGNPPKPISPSSVSPPPVTSAVTPAVTPPPVTPPPPVVKPVEPVKPPPPKPDPHADRYTRARAALEAGSFSSAIDLLTEIQRADPSYRDVGALLARAREGQRGLAQNALEAGVKLENSGDLVGAVQQYDRARELDSSLGGVADESAKRVRGRMRTEGTDAYTRARQADAVGRTADAITFYDRAARYLPDDDPNKKIARDRLEVLRAKR